MRGVVRTFLLFFVPAVVVLTAGLVLVQASLSRADMRALEAGQVELVQAMKATIVAEVASIRADALVIADSPIDSLDEAGTARYAAALAAFVRHKGVYERIRLINARGWEIVRVSYGGGIVSVVTSPTVSDRPGRARYGESLRLQSGELYLSRFEVDVEQSGAAAVLKPMIRVAAPVTSGSGGAGTTVVLDYLGEHMIQTLRLSAGRTPGELMLLDNDGYWLAAPRPEDEWGFAIDERSERTLARSYPEAARRLYSRLTGQVRLAEGLFTFDTVFPHTEGWRSEPPVVPDPSRAPGYLWKIVSRVPPSVLAQSDSARLRRMVPFFAIALLVIAAGSHLLAREVTRRREQERQARESEARRRRLLERIRDAYFEMDADGRLTEVSAAALVVFGYSQDRMVGRTLQELGASADLLQALTEQGSVADLQVAVRGPDGALRQCSVNAWTVESDGEPRRFVGTAREITERLRLEEHLRPVAAPGIRGPSRRRDCP